MFEMVGRPIDGRTFAGSRRVRLGDCSPGGRLRLDAAARYLQDLSDDDTRDAGLAQMTWVVRRTVIDVWQFPTYLEPLDMVTWCSGIGSRWAERRVDMAFFELHAPFNERDVDLGDRTRGELRLKRALYGVGLGDENKARGILIEPVDDAGT